MLAAPPRTGCGDENHHDRRRRRAGDPQANSAANTNVRLPPSILATRSFTRCADNSVVTVDYLSDNKSANVHAGKEEHIDAGRSGRSRQADDRRGPLLVEGLPGRVERGQIAGRATPRQPATPGARGLLALRGPERRCGGSMLISSRDSLAERSSLALGRQVAAPSLAEDTRFAATLASDPRLSRCASEHYGLRA